MDNRISIPDEVIEKIKRLVDEGRFRDVGDFLTQAAKLMIYAEEKKEEFTKIVQRKDEP